MTLPEISIRRHVFAWMISFIFILFGYIGYQKIGVDRFPMIEFPVLSVTTTLEGANPEIIDSSITNLIETAVNTVTGIESIKSQSSPGVSVVTITFELDKDIEGLTTTVDLKQVEMDQFRNANQNRVDQIDDGSYNKLTDNDTLFNNDYGTGNGDGEGTAKEVKGLFGEEFGKNLNLFSGTIGLLGAVAGKDEATAKVMTVVAKLQMANALMTRVNLMMEQKGAGLKAMFSAFIGAPARQGGIMSKHGRSYSDGGVADGPSSGYPAVLHGKEAVVPLPNGRSIPVDMGKGGGGTNNVSINVNMAEGTTETVSDRDEAKALGVAINQAVYQVLEKEQRQGGLLGA